MSSDPSSPLHGKNVVLTGGTAGIGVGLFKEIVRLGAAKVFLLCRSQQRGESLKSVGVNAGTDVEIVLANLNSMKEVVKAAQLICGSGIAIDLVFLNAGLMPGATAIMSAEGIEESLAVNVCCQHALVRTIIPTLAPGARIIVTGSDAGSFVKWSCDVANVNGAAPMGPIGFKQYARTKCLAHTHAAALSQQLDAAGLDVHCCVFHPGAVDSQMGDQLAPWLAKYVVKPLLRPFFRTPVMAAAFAVHAATAPAEQMHNAYFEHGNFGTPKDFAPKRPIPGGADAAACEAAWGAVEALVAKALEVDALPPLRR